MPYVCSTSTNDVVYCNYEKGGQDMPVLARKVLIKGGANRGGKGLVTPHGMITPVTDAELEFLKGNTAFNRHMKRGFVSIVEQLKAPEADAVAKDMTPKDASAPLTEADYQQGGRMFGKGAPDAAPLEPPASIGKAPDKKKGKA